MLIFGQLLSSAAFNAETLGTLLAPLPDLDRKWRIVVPSLLIEDGSSSAGLQSPEEHTALMRAYEAWEEDSTQHESDKTEKWRKAHVKKWLGSQEVLE